MLTFHESVTQLRIGRLFGTLVRRHATKLEAVGSIPGRPNSTLGPTRRPWSTHNTHICLVEFEVLPFFRSTGSVARFINYTTSDSIIPPLKTLAYATPRQGTITSPIFAPSLWRLIWIKQKNNRRCIIAAQRYVTLRHRTHADHQAIFTLRLCFVYFHNFISVFFSGRTKPRSDYDGWYQQRGSRAPKVHNSVPSCYDGVTSLCG